MYTIRLGKGQDRRATERGKRNVKRVGQEREEICVLREGRRKEIKGKDNKKRDTLYGRLTRGQT